MKKIKKYMIISRLFFALLLILVTKFSKRITLVLIFLIFWTHYSEISEMLHLFITILEKVFGMVESLLISIAICSLLLGYAYTYEWLKTLVWDEELVRKLNKVGSKKSKDFRPIKSKVPPYEPLRLLINELLKEKSKPENKPSPNWTSSNFDYLLLNSKDRKLVISFFKALIKVGRNILTETAIEYDPPQGQGEKILL